MNVIWGQPYTSVEMLGSEFCAHLTIKRGEVLCCNSNSSTRRALVLSSQQSALAEVQESQT